MPKRTNILSRLTEGIVALALVAVFVALAWQLGPLDGMHHGDELRELLGR